MTEIKKACKIHGELALEDIIVMRPKKEGGKNPLACRICNKINCKKKYEERRILEGRKRNDSWVNGQKVCKIHGELSDDEIIKTKQPRNVSGWQIRCKKCVTEQKWKANVICKTHGQLKAEDIKGDGRCKLCHRLSANRKRNSNREWFNAKMAEDRAKNPEKWKEIYKKAYQKKIEKFDRETINTKEIIRMHGLTHEQYEKMQLEQNGLCKICRQPETRKSRAPGKITRLVVDHCHETNKVRGLLCHQCNLLLGAARDNADILATAMAYLQTYQSES